MLNLILELKKGHTNKTYILLKTLFSRGRVFSPSVKIEHLIIFEFSCSNYEINWFGTSTDWMNVFIKLISVCKAKRDTQIRPTFCWKLLYVHVPLNNLKHQTKGLQTVSESFIKWLGKNEHLSVNILKQIISNYDRIRMWTVNYRGAISEEYESPCFT